MSQPLTLQSTPVLQPKSERVLMIAWFISLAAILLLAAAVLHASEKPLLDDVATKLVYASGLCLAALLAAVIVTWRKRDWLWPRWRWRFVGLAVAALAALIAAQLGITSDDPGVTMYQSTLLWLIAIGGALIAAWPRLDTSAKRELTPRPEIWILGGILALALVLRVIDLTNVPYALMGDETKFALQARAINQGLLFHPFTTAIDGHWEMFFMVLGFFLRVGGETVEAARLHSALFGALSVLAMYALTRQLWGRRAGFIAAALLATYHLHLHFSRNAMNNIYDALFSMTVFGFIWLGWQTQHRWPWLLGALALGFAQFFYVGGRVILAQLAVLGIFWLITDRARLKTQALNLALAVGVFLVTFMPVAYFAQLRFDDYMTRFNQTNIIRNGWLEAAAQAQHTSEAQILVQQFTDTVQEFVAGPDTLFYQGQALLTPPIVILAALGLLYLLWHLKEGRAFYLLSSLALIILIGGVLTLSPLGGAHHFVGAGPLIYIAIAVVIDRVLARSERHWPRARRGLLAATILVILGLMCIDAYYYFGVYIPHQELISGDVEWGMKVGEYLHSVETRPESWHVVCLEEDILPCRHSSIEFLAPRASQTMEVIARNVSLTRTSALPAGNLVIVVGPNRSEADMLRTRFPQAITQRHYGIRGDLLFTSFEVPANPSP